MGVIHSRAEKKRDRAEAALLMEQAKAVRAARRADEAAAPEGPSFAERMQARTEQLEQSKVVRREAWELEHPGKTAPWYLR